MHVKLDADWLVCKIECIPQSGTFELDVPVEPTPPSRMQRMFEQALAARPVNVDGAEAIARVADNALHFEVRGLPAAVRGGEAAVFPEIAGVVDNPAPVRQQWNGETWTRELAALRAAQRQPRESAAGAARSTTAQPARGRAPQLRVAWR